MTCPTRAAPVLGATVRATVPLAFPVWPEVTEIQPSPVDALQAQPAIVFTSTESRPPAEPIASPLRLKLN